MRLTRGLLAIAIVAAVSVGSLGFAMSLVESYAAKPADVTTPADVIPNPCASQVSCMIGCMSIRQTPGWQLVGAYNDGARCNCIWRKISTTSATDGVVPVGHVSTISCRNGG